MYGYDALKQKGAFEQEFTIERLVEISGASKRSIYSYVKAGAVDPPDRSGRRHVWTHSHLHQIADVRRKTKAGSALVALATARHEGRIKPFAKSRASSSAPSVQILRSAQIKYAPGLVMHIDRKLTKGQRSVLRIVGELIRQAFPESD